jgi:hypothetical protein
LSTFEGLAGVAERQLGLITTGQAERIGIKPNELARFAAEGLVWEPDWSVFQLTSSDVAPRYSYPYAAWLALTPNLFAWERPPAVHEDAVLSHESACQVWGLGSFAAPVVRFIAPVRLTGVRAVDVQLDALTPDQVTRHHGVPVTTPQRVIVDLLREGTDHDDVRRALTDAVRLDLVDLQAVYDELLPRAGEFQLPVDGAEFAGRLLGELEIPTLSERNRRAFDALVGHRG